MRSLLLLLTFALATIGRADVLGYKGVGTCRLPNDTAQLSKTPKLYFIVDLANNTGYVIFFFTLNGVKNQQNTFPINPVHYNSGPLASKTLGTFTYVSDTGTPSSFAVTMFYFRGKEISLQIRTGVFANYPKTLTGIYRAATNSTLDFNDEINFVLTYDAFHTQAANNLFKSGATTADDINAELIAKGF